MPGFGWVV
ncbi:unnamed protein product, partial [Rotaria sp. Silwood1]